MWTTRWGKGISIACLRSAAKTARLTSDRTGATLTTQSAWGSVSVVSSSGSVLDSAADAVINVYANELKLSVTPAGVGAVGIPWPQKPPL